MTTFQGFHEHHRRSRTSTASLIGALYEDNVAGGNLHIVLDDGNTEAHHIAWCATNAADEDDHLGFEIALRLLQLTEAEVTSLYAARPWEGAR
ncbi:MAG: hypothetical protein HKN01_01445 [Acidimicrobiia bacterium]|nr:hypothetical protein [Acidimicrobiia bacterium]